MIKVDGRLPLQQDQDRQPLPEEDLISVDVSDLELKIRNTYTGELPWPIAPSIATWELQLLWTCEGNRASDNGLAPLSLLLVQPGFG